MYAQIIDKGNTLEPTRQKPPPRRGSSNSSTHNLCFGSEIRRIVHPCLDIIYCKCNIKVEDMGIHSTDMNQMNQENHVRVLYVCLLKSFFCKEKKMSEK